jgi:DNA replication ATP-dependent helicase Dna2
MAAHTPGQPEEAARECFLCVLDPHPPCATTQLDGRIIAAFERTINGEKTPTIILDTGTARVEVRLIHNYYGKFVKELNERGTTIHTLALRLYHLPTPPVITEYKNQSRYIYQSNAYTLAVLEPDVLLNITDLNHAEYCSRQYLLNMLVPSTTSAAAIRGNLVHHCFKELLKEHDRGELMHGHAVNGQETPLATLQRHFERALDQSRLELALADVSVEDMRAEVTPHLESLAAWYQQQSATLWDIPVAPVDHQSGEPGAQRSENIVRAETFLLAPEIGLRGRLDLLWQQTNQRRLLELKTGGGSGNLPKSSHRWQVQGYHALLAVRRDPRMKKARGTLLYSGTPGEAQAFGIEPTIRDIQRVNETRNILVLSHLTGIPSAPPGPSRCTRCSMLPECEQVSSLLSWQPPEPAVEEPSHNEDRSSSANSAVSPPVSIPPTFSDEDKSFFASYYHLLQLEGRESEQQQALLWKTPVVERIESGTAINDLVPSGKPEPTGQGEWEQVFLCTNTSELREGDEILLSDGNPITGEVVTGNIKHISAEHVRVWIPELIANPLLIDRYGSNIVHVRTMQNLLRWLRADIHLRDLVAGRSRPKFGQGSVPPRQDFNTEQNLAVERALQMQDYLLVQGPPGTGKTSVIAEIVKRLSQQGQRILLAAYTNQAVDNMLKRLDSEGFHDYLRLGHDRNVHIDVQSRLLKHLLAEKNPLSDVRELLYKTPVVASTTSTWSSEKYAPPSSSTTPGTSSPLQFDVAIIDEASQITIPALLGTLRLAKRFILVGDEKQLPPLVLSKEAAAQGLADSLFSHLKRLDNDHVEEQGTKSSACVSLRLQYRMNRWISHFASKVFYEDTLAAAPAIARRVLEFQPSWNLITEESPVITQAIRPAYPMVFLDVHARDAHIGPKSSNAEARAVRALVQGLLARGIAQEDIGIIAPYRAQVANIRRHLFSDDVPGEWHGIASDTPMSIDTVDRFQGGERMIIIMSFATSQTPTLESHLREFLTNPTRLNVALTRAQRKLIIVGSAQALEPLPYFQRLLSYCKSMNTVLQYSE